MTKRNEIEMLDHLISQLEVSKTYSGAFLRSVYPSIVSAIHSDIMPEVYCMSTKEFEKHRDDIIANAKEEAKAIIENAKVESERILENGQKWKEMCIDQVRAALRQLEK